MRLMLAAVVLVTVAAACSPGDEETATTIDGSSTTATSTVVTTAPPEPPAGSAVVVGVLEIPETLNPIAPGGTRPASTLVQQAMLPGAYVYDPATWHVLPDLVVRVPSVADGDVSVFGDRQTVTWTIDPEAEWSDGVPVSGADFAFTLQAVFGQTECGGRAGIDSLFGFQVVDVGDKTISVEMPGPTAAYETMFRAVLPSHATDGATVCTDDGVAWPSTGPFIARSLSDDRVRLVRNETYWRDPPVFAAVEFVLHPDEPSMGSAVAAGNLDVAVVDSTEVANSARDDGVEVIATPSGRLEHLAFDFRSGDDGAEQLLEVLEFRQGVARAIDTEGLAADIGWLPVQGVARTAASPTPWDVYGFDVDEARRLIGEACEEAGLDCFANPPEVRLVATGFGVRPEVVARVVADLAAVGVTAAVDEVASVGIADRIADGGWDMAVLSLTEPAGVNEAARWLISSLEPGGVGDVYGYGASGSIAATERAAFQLRLFAGQLGAAPDPARAGRLLDEAHELAARGLMFVPLVARPRYTLVGDGLEGVVPNTSPSGVTWNIGRWGTADP